MPSPAPVSTHTVCPCAQYSRTAAGVSLRHGLVDDRQRPRAFQGWWITRVIGAGYVYEPTSQPDASRYLRLQSSATVTVDLWVY